MLTAAVAAGKKVIETAYDISKLAEILDFVSIMAYDLHGYWDGITGHHTALVDPSGSNLTVTFAVDYWLSKVEALNLLFNVYFTKNNKINKVKA